jgi:hypothetical protein
MVRHPNGDLQVSSINGSIDAAFRKWSRPDKMACSGMTLPSAKFDLASGAAETDFPFSPEIRREVECLGGAGIALSD